MSKKPIVIVIVVLYTILAVCMRTTFYRGKTNGYEAEAFIGSLDSSYQADDDDETWDTADKFDVSVVIPIYNSKEFLAPCLDSLFNQTLSSIEYIFVDDQGTDNSTGFIEDYINAHKITRTVRILRNPQNSGPGYSRNAGIEAARGRYVGFVDPDDWISLNFYESLYNSAVLKNGTFYDVAKAAMITFSNNKYTAAAKPAVPVTGREPYVYERFAWQHFTGLFRRRLLVEHPYARYGSSRVGEDLMFLLTTGFYANNITFTSKGKYFYRNRKNSLMHQQKEKVYKYDLEARKEMMNFYFEHVTPDKYSETYINFQLKTLLREKNELRKLYGSTKKQSQSDLSREFLDFYNFVKSQASNIQATQTTTAPLNRRGNF